jgi:hypothetical protein
MGDTSAPAIVASGRKLPADVFVLVPIHCRVSSVHLFPAWRPETAASSADSHQLVAILAETTPVTTFTSARLGSFLALCRLTGLGKKPELR